MYKACHIAKRHYFSCIHSYLSYANLTLGSTNKSKLTPLYRQQKHAARIIFFKDSLSQANPLVKQINALTLFIPGGGLNQPPPPPPPLIFFYITFEVFIVTPSNFVTFPNFYLSLLCEKNFLENMPQCCLGNYFLEVSKYFFLK